MDNRRIFIGGTGRSGTTLLYDLLGQNQDVYAFPVESRFIIDNGGLTSLFDGLTANYSPSLASQRLMNFKDLMCNDLITPGKEPYLGYNLLNHIDSQHYRNVFNDFYRELYYNHYYGRPIWLDNKHDEFIFRIKAKFARKLLPNKKELQFANRIPEGKFFNNESELLSLMRKFVDGIFSLPMNEAGAKTWCEKTPHNILHYSFINRMFPDSMFVHIKRNPIAIIQSFMKMAWAPNDLESCSYIVRDILLKWFEEIQKVSNQEYYLEVKLEDFAQNPENLLKEIAEKCDISTNFGNLDKISVNKTGIDKYKISDEDLKKIQNILGEEIEHFGYAI